MERTEVCSVDFSEQFRRDKQVYVNLAEFAALHEIDGKRVPCVLTSSRRGHMTQDGVYQKSILLYVGAEYVRTPVPDMQVRVDGVNYVIESCECLMSELWKIELTRSVG